MMGMFSCDECNDNQQASLFEANFALPFFLLKIWIFESYLLYTVHDISWIAQLVEFSLTVAFA